MAQLKAYLSFGGNCREAMSFYRDCLGGELKIMEVGETPMAAQFPPEARKQVMHASLVSGAISLLASDSLRPGDEPRQGNTMSLMLDCGSEEEIRRSFAALSAGARVDTPLRREFWGALYGDLVDKYGFRWMFNFEEPRA